MINDNFFGRRRSTPTRPVPPGQYLEDGFPVLSAGPTPRVDLNTWDFSIEIAGETAGTWSWESLNSLEQTDMHTDIHCVTKWSKQDTNWRGVAIDTLLADAQISPPDGYVMAYCDGGYTTNVPAKDLMDGKGILAHTYENEPLPAEHGGPVRLFIPHLYLWKSAKWIRRLRFMEKDEPGFWEGYGYHMYGDPWLEQRYTGD